MVSDIYFLIVKVDLLSAFNMNVEAFFHCPYFTYYIIMNLDFLLFTQTGGAALRSKIEQSAENPSNNTWKQNSERDGIHCNTLGWQPRSIR